MVEDYFEVKGNWAHRRGDGQPADSVERASDDQAIFQWSDGERFYCSSVLWPDAQDALKGQSDDQSLNVNACGRCEQHGGFKVGVDQRPKYSNGGWEVHVKTMGKQVWSQRSCSSNPVAGSLCDTVAYANGVATRKAAEFKEKRQQAKQMAKLKDQPSQSEDGAKASEAGSPTSTEKGGREPTQSAANVRAEAKVS